MRPDHLLESIDFRANLDLDSEVEDIVVRCQGGEKLAFEELFALYQPRLKYYGVIRRMGS